MKFKLKSSVHTSFLFRLCEIFLFEYVFFERHIILEFSFCFKKKDFCIKIIANIYKTLFYYIILFQVGKETINSSDDALLKQDMPAALQRVEGASRLLEEASAMLKEDPYSGPAR